MKRLFKFFPVALAAVALASCSSDDLQSENAQALQLEDGKLYVEVEGNTTTRGGFASAVYANSNGVNTLFNALMFEEGDRIKVYCDQHNWRSQVWKLGQDQQYLKANGVASFEPEVEGEEKYVKDDEIAYGIYPYTNVKTSETETDKAAQYGWFTDEDRTSMEFNFRDQAKIAYSSEAYDYQKTANGAFTGETVEGNFYKTPFPLWGVKDAGKQVMTMKYLTGILRIDYTVTADAAANTNNYLVIVADQQLNGTFVANDVDPTKLGTETPVLTPGGAAITIDDEVMTAAGVVDANAIVVNMGNKKGHKLVYLPLPAQVYGTLKVYTGKDIAASTTLSTATVGGNLTELYDVIDKGLIDTENETQNAKDKTANTVNAGVWYRVNDDSGMVDTEASSPFQMVQAIIAADKEAYRDFTIEFQRPINVDNSDDAPQRQWIDFQNTVANYGLGEAYSLNHNVTVKATLKGASANQVLKIKNIGGAKLTLNITQDGTNPVGIDVTDGLTSELVLDGALKNVTNASSGKLTIAGAVADGSKVTTSGEITIDESTTTNAVADLVIEKGCTKVNVLDGTVTKVEFASANDKKIAADVELHTEGTGYLAAVDYKNVPQASGNKTFTYNVNYTSKWDGKTKGNVLTTISCGTDNVKGLTVNGNAVENVTSAITSAAQLAGVTVSTATRILAKEIDLDGKDLQNTNALAGALNGNYNVFAKSADAAAAATIAQADIKNLQIGNAATALVTNGNYGLFKTSGENAEVYNLKISDAKVLGTTGNILANVGTLIGKATAAVKVKNVDVTGLNVTITGATDYTTTTNDLNIGGVIGQVTGGTATMLDVTTAGAISANGTLGGIIGNVAAAANSKAQFGQDKETSGKHTADQECSSTISMTVTPGLAEYDPLYAMVGTLVGSSYFDGAGVEIYTKTALTPSIAVPEKAKASRMTANFAILRYNIERGLDEVGFSGLTDVTVAMTNWKVNVYVYNNTPTASATAKEYVAKAYNQTAPHTTGWTIADYAAKTTPEYCAWNISTQYTTSE